MSWDWENKNIGYLLGGLFAVLEKIQEKAAGGPGKLNSTIRDRYYGAFSSTPVTVLPTLMKLKNYHIGKKEINFKWHEDIIGRISNEIDAKTVPAHMSLQEQAQFAIGYYQMRYYGG